jgi:hypothetical protein
MPMGRCGNGNRDLGSGSDTKDNNGLEFEWFPYSQ